MGRTLEEIDSEIDAATAVVERLEAERNALFGARYLAMCTAEPGRLFGEALTQALSRLGPAEEASEYGSQAESDWFVLGPGLRFDITVEYEPGGEAE